MISCSSERLLVSNNGREPAASESSSKLVALKIYRKHRAQQKW